MSFSNLKNNRKKAIDDLVNAVASTEGSSGKKSYGDDRFWKPTRDKAGNGYAVIRFLPAKEGEDLPWVKYFDHGFKGPTGQWYIENSLTSIGQDDPVTEANSVLWNTGREEDKQTARDRKRRLHYVSNILVVSDPSNPENEGKVMLYKFGKKIFDKVMDVMQPEFQDEEPVNPYDFWEGADFKIKIRKVDGWVSYDKSEFSKPEGLFDGDDERLEEIYNKLYSLQDFIDPKNYKSYADLKAKLNKVLGVQAGHDAAAPSTLPENTAAPTIAATAPSALAEPEADASPAPSAADDEEDTLSYFAKLAQKDD